MTIEDFVSTVNNHLWQVSNNQLAGLFKKIDDLRDLSKWLTLPNNAGSLRMDLCWRIRRLLKGPSVTLKYFESAVSQEEIADVLGMDSRLL